MLDVVQGVGGINCKSYKDNVGFRVRQGPQSLVVLLSCSIPQCQLHALPIYSAIRHVVFEYSWNLE